MTDKKITELTAITTPADADIVPIVDIDANTTKKITAANLATYVNASYPAETIRDTIGDMLTGNTETDITVTHDDANDKINFVVSVAAANLPTSIDAAKIANGNVSNDEFQALDGVTSGIQAQLDAKVDLAGDTMTGTLAMGNNAITTSSTVDGRDLSVDGTKLDAIEASATADQTASEIRTLVEAATDSNVFTDADHTKLNAIEASATADQTGAEIKSAYEGEADTNAFTDADHTKLDAIEASADVTDATNVTAAGALMDSECTDLAAVKGINQALTTTSSPTFTGVTAALTGNSSTATALATARDIALGGEVTGTASFDGSANVTITSTIAANTIGVNELACSDGSADQFLKTNGSGTISFASVTGATTINNAVTNRLVSVATVTSDFDAEANLTFDGSTLALTGNMTVSGNVDGRDVSADGTKLDGIETSATADQTGAEIKTAYEAESDTNAFTDALLSKLNAIEASATADQTNAEIRTAVEAATDSNVFTDADHTKLNGIETSADVTDATNVDAAGAIMNSDLGTKGQIVVGDGTGDPTILSVGTDGHYLKADSSAASGVAWASIPGNAADDITTGDAAVTIATSTGNITIDAQADDSDIIFKGTDGGVDTTFLTLDGSEAGSATFNHDIFLPDNGKVVFGAGSDLEIHHNGSNSIIEDTGTGNLQIKSSGQTTLTDDFEVNNNANNKVLLRAVDGAGVSLYHNNTKVVETTANGLEIPDNYELRLGTGSDLKIFHENTNNHSVIKEDGGGHLKLQAENLLLMNADASETYIECVHNGSTQLYHDNSKKLETASGGISVTGSITASSNITAYSSRKLKSDIETIDNALDKVSQMRGVTFTKDNEKSSGVIAEELEEVAPELVIDGEYKSVAYGNIVGYLIEAIKELKAEVEELKKG